MTEAKASYRNILRSSSIIGGASVVNIAVGVLRTKVLAVLLGPTGVGLTSLYNGLMTTAAAFSTMGVGTVGARQVAEAAGRNDGRSMAVVRRAMFWGTMLLACLGALVVWSLRSLLAAQVLGDASQGRVVGWLSIGVALSVASASQGAMIQGMRRVGDLARLSVFGSAIATILGLAFLWRWGTAGLVAYVVVVPAASFALGHFYVSRLPKVKVGALITTEEIVVEWKKLLGLGVAFVAAELVGALVQMWIRVDVERVLGAAPLGHYQAAWTISTQYIAFVLAAMAADYYPRLTGVIRNPEAAGRLVNEQTEIAMLLTAPVFIAMMATAPWVIRLLYTASFAPAVEILRWQVLGDVLKVASWPLGFVILAAGDGKAFFWSESASWIVMAALIGGLTPVMGLRITGIASLACYAFYLPLVYWLAWRRIDFHWSRAIIRLVVMTFAISAAVGIIAALAAWGMVPGIVIAAGFGLFALGRISQMSGIEGPVGRMGATARRLTGQ